jgi:hypothetical protein
MLPIDPGDGPGSYLPGAQPPVCAPDGKDRHHIGRTSGLPGGTPPVPRVLPVRPLNDIVPLHAMVRGGTIIRPGAVAWGGTRDAGEEGGYSSCEAIERILAAVVRNPGALPGLLAELAGSRLWVPLPARYQPFTDGAAVRLPLIGYRGTDFVPAFTSVQRLTSWANQADRSRPAQRAGDARVIPHIVVPAAGLAERLPAGLGLALNPGSVPGLPLYPECVPYLARLAAPRIAQDGLAMELLVSGTGDRFLIGHPPTEPRALLAEARGALLAVPAARRASRAWLSVPGHGEGLVIAIVLDDPGCDQARMAAIEAIERAAVAVPLRVPFPLDITFPGESSTGPDESGFPGIPGPEAIDAWIARSIRPFYTRDLTGRRTRC